MKVSRKGRRAMAVGAAKSDMRRGMKAQWKDHKGRRGEAVGMAERALIDKWHREKDSDRKAKPGPQERAARHGRMKHHTSLHHRDLYDRHHQSLGDRIRESAGAAAYDATRGKRRR
jgi:hypothetical protein